MIYRYCDKQPSFANPFAGWIADSADVIGDVFLGHRSSVWFGSVIRSDQQQGRIIIGDYTNIQENSVIHTDEGIDVIIGNYVTVGHKAMLHGCTVDDNSLIGIGAIILNHAKIGKNCIIGANSLVTEGKVIPDNSLVMGSPAKVIKTLSSEQIAMIRKSAINYADKAQNFKVSLTAVTLAI